LWSARRAITSEEREAFGAAVEVARVAQERPTESCAAGEAVVRSERAMARCAIRLALEACGYLHYKRRTIPPPLQRQKADSFTDRAQESTITIKKDGDKLSGTMAWPDQKESKLADVKIRYAELTFYAERELMDMKFTIKYTLKVEKDSFKGKGEADVGGEKREFDVEGKQEKKEEKKDE
jgi:hypothetical protein